jgi:Tol biopolymer transport system component
MMEFIAMPVPAKGRAFLILALVAALAAALLAVSTVGIDPAEARKKASGSKIVFVSDRTTGKGVDNPEGDDEIFITNPDGTGRKQLTKNAASESNPVLSPGGKKVAYDSEGVQTSNPEADGEVYVVNADGSRAQNLTSNAVSDTSLDFSPGGKKIVYRSSGTQTSNPEGDGEVYLINADGSGLKNLTNNGSSVDDSSPDWGRMAR